MPETPSVRFVVLFQGRTGSTFFVEALDGHPDVSADYEVLSSRKWRRREPAEQLAHARELLTGGKGEGSAVYGFKTKLRDVRDPDGFAGLLRETSSRIILLDRRNVVKLAVSAFNSMRIHEQTGDWNLYGHAPALDEALEIPVDDLREALRKRERYQEQLLEYVAQVARPTLLLYYEDLLAGTDEALAIAFGFLGVEPAPVTGRAVKATSDDLREVVANFDELRQAFAGTKYEWMFDEVLVPSDVAGEGRR